MKSCLANALASGSTKVLSFDKYSEACKRLSLFLSLVPSFFINFKVSSVIVTLPNTSCLLTLSELFKNFIVFSRRILN